LRVDRDEMRIERAHEQSVAQHRKAAIVGATADFVISRADVLVNPEDAPCRRIHCNDIIWSVASHT
jgi:hypothetical protein